MLDERAIARLAVAQRCLSGLAIARIAQADDKYDFAVQACLADRDLGRKERAVRMQSEGLMRRQVDLRVIRQRSQIGSASCRERVCKYGENEVVGVPLKKK